MEVENKDLEGQGNEGQPKEKTYSEREFKGLLSDKQREAQARQDLQARLAAKETQYEQQLADLKSKLEEKEAADDGDPEDVVTISKLNKKIASLEKKLVSQYSQDKQEGRKKEVEQSWEDARKKYTEDKAGQGLAFDEVMEGTNRMIAKNPKYRELILNDPNPGETAYNVGLQDSVIAERAKTYKKELSSSKAPKDSLEGGTVPAGYFTQAYVKKMSKEPGWIKNNLNKIRESQKQWNKDPNK